MREPPLVYVVVLSWNHWEVTAVCLQSLSCITYPNYQIVLVDNHSSDGTAERARQQFPTMRVIANDRNLGFAAGCNVGIRHALAQQADYIFLLNNDAVVPPDVLDKLVAEAGILPDLGMLAPLLSYQDDPQRFWFAGSLRHPLTLEAVSFGPLGLRQNIVPEKNIAVDYLFGTAVLIPGPVLRHVGLFDERFFLYYEDMDLCLRLQAAGYALYATPQVIVQHGISVSTDSLSTMRYYHKARGSILFFRKHVQGRRWLIVLPYRIGSALRTVMRLTVQKQTSVAQAYLCGLYDGWRNIPLPQL